MSTSQAPFPPPGVIPARLDVRLKDPGRHPTGRGFPDAHRRESHGSKLEDLKSEVDPVKRKLLVEP